MNVFKVLILGVILLVGCSRGKKSETVSVPQKETKIVSVNYGTLTDSIELDLDYFCSNMKCIALDSQHDALFGDGAHVVTANDNKILIETEKKLLWFDGEGNYNKILLRQGRGANEYVAFMHPYLVDSCLYYTDMKYRDRYVKCDFNTNELGFVTKPKGYVNDYIIKNDTIYSLLQFVENKCFIARLVVQTTKGELLSKKVIGKRSTTPINLSSYRMFLSSDQVSLASPHGDTIWNVTNGQKKECWTTVFEERYIKGKSHQSYPKWGVIEFNNRFILAKSQTIKHEGRVIRRINPGIVYVDRIDGQKGVISHFKYGGLKIPPTKGEIHINSKEYFVMEFSAFDFLQLIEKTDLNKLDPTIQEIMKKLKPEDNSVLLIGKYRK